MPEDERTNERPLDPGFLQTLLDTIPNPIFYKDVSGIYLGCNKAFENFLGLSKIDIIGKSVYDIASKELADIYYVMDQSLFNKLGVQTYEASVKYADGTMHDVIFNKAAFYLTDGSLGGLVGVMQDISERKRAESILSQSELLTRSSLDSLSARIAILDAEGAILATNSAWKRFAESSGLADYEFLGVNYLAICNQDSSGSRDYAAAVAAGICSVISGEVNEFSLEYPCHSESEQHWFNARVTRTWGGEPLRVVVAHEDVTSRKLADEALRKAHYELEDRVRERTVELAKANQELLIRIAEHENAEERIVQQNEFLNHVLESLTHPFYVLDANDYTIKMANSAVAPGGIPPGTACYALSHRKGEPCRGSDHLCPLQMIKETKKPITVEHVHYDKDGVPRNVEIHAYPIFDRQGNVAQIIEYTLDITERKRMEEELLSTAEKIKLFAYAVSHDLKSPIIGINGLARLLHKQYQSILDEKGKKYCEQILKASEQMLLLVQEINVYIKTKESPLELENVRPKEILQLVKDEFEALLSSRRIAWLEPEKVPDIKADKVCMVRVFRNLVDNALKYGGEDLSEIRIGYEDSDDSHIFSVSDDGVGLDKEHSHNIFDLFQRHETSKGIEGTGLGLAIVKGIIKKHHGRVWVGQGHHDGVTFYFSISKLLG